MKKWKQALALVLALVMALSLVALPSFAEGEETGGGTAATQPVWPAEGSIKLDKDAKAVEGSNNLWEVTLGIQGKNYKTTSDVVLVIDCSGSMEGTKLANTQKAAKAFGDKLLTEGSTTRIAIVTFIDTATAYNSGHFYTASELPDFKAAVDNATYASGATNQQAGIHVAQQLLTPEASIGKQKNIVILSDGAATKSHPFVATATYANCEAWTGLGCPRGGNITNIGAFVPDYDVVIPDTGNQFTMSYNAYVNATCTKHGYTNLLSYGVYALDGTVTRTSGTNNGVATIWEANQAKTAGTTIFSVALQAGTEGENTLKSCATDAAKGYYAIGQNDNVEEKLTAAFEAIAGSIAIAASNGTVADTMGEKVQLSFTGAAPVITTDKAVYDAGNADVYISQGSATYDTTNRQINWNVGNVREGDNPIMKYKVTVKGTTVPPPMRCWTPIKRPPSAIRTTWARIPWAPSRFPRSPWAAATSWSTTIWSMTRASPSTKTALWWLLPPWLSRSRPLLTTKRMVPLACPITSATRFSPRMWPITTISASISSTMVT